jgi:hypothetical protein
MVGGSLQSTFSQKPNTYGVIDNITNLGQPNETSQDNYKSISNKYDSDQINDIIYRLYEDYAF